MEESKSVIPGLYVGVKFDRTTINKLDLWRKSQNLPPNDPDNGAPYHCTVVYSRTAMPWTVADCHGKEAAATAFDVLGKNEPGMLVLRIRCAWIETRHKEAKELGATWDFPSFIPHISICKVFKGLNVRNLKLPTFKLVLAKEYAEELKE